MEDAEDRLANMMEVWYSDLEQMTQDNRINKEVTTISKLKLKRIKREIEEEIKEYDSKTK